MEDTELIVNLITENVDKCSCTTIHSAFSPRISLRSTAVLLRLTVLERSSFVFSQALSSFECPGWKNWTNWIRADCQLRSRPFVQGISSLYPQTKTGNAFYILDLDSPSRSIYIPASCIALQSEYVLHMARHGRRIKRCGTCVERKVKCGTSTR